jgi:DNA-3-methyladenine glycosylase II
LGLGAKHKIGLVASMPPRVPPASTTKAWLKERLGTPELLAAHLQALIKLDKRLKPIMARAGQVDLRTGERGFPGMAKVICGQQLSTASAAAIWKRLIALPGAAEPTSFLDLDEPTLRAAGLSGGKINSIRAVAEAIIGGGLDFAAVQAMPAEDAVAHLTAIKGVGPWTAEIYLLFCVGHPDVFPAGDLALKKVAQEALGLPELPTTRALVEIAENWSPHRGAAALLFWRYFHATRDKEGVAI